MISKIRKEITNYIGGGFSLRDITINPYEDVKQWERIANHQYKNGDKDSQGNHKFWYDIITPAIMSETKNIDFDIKDIMIYFESIKSNLKQIIANQLNRKWMDDNGIGIKFNEMVEESTGWGDMLLKKTKDTPYYETLNLVDTFVVNPLARTVSGKTPDSAVIERHVLNKTKFEQAGKAWFDDKVKEALEECPNMGFFDSIDGGSNIDPNNPYYEIWERNGEVSLADLREAQGKEYDPKYENEYTLAKIVCIINPNKDDDKIEGSILYAGEIKEMPYKEYHRNKYTGTWLRGGFFKMLKDIQRRANEIGNQIARALEFGGQQIYSSEDDLIFENILTDLSRGDIIKTKGLSRVDASIPDLSNYISEWNLLIAQRNEITNNNEVVQGETPAGTPFKLGRLLNQNANKYYDFIREKLGLCMQEVFRDWILPNSMKNITAQEIVEITGDEQMMKKYYEIKVNSWYLRNLARFAPHNSEVANTVKADMVTKMLAKKTKEKLKIDKNFWKDCKASALVVITGENVNLTALLDDYATFIQLESDPKRRTALIEMAMSRRGIDVSSLPRTEQPQQPQQSLNTNTLNTNTLKNEQPVQQNI